MKEEKRSSGILLHLTSLPGPSGIGDLGPGAFRFADFLCQAGQSVWQVLPCGPTGYLDSPYQALSAWAGDPLLVALEPLCRQGWLRSGDLPSLPSGERVDFEAARQLKGAFLRRAWEGFTRSACWHAREDFEEFCRSQEDWLKEYALFAALKRFRKGEPWSDWPRPLRDRDPRELAKWRRRLEGEIRRESFAQYLFAGQWRRLRRYCRRRGLRLMGDLPIYVAHDSSDVWVRRNLFQLDGRGRPPVVGGVPPDRFSPRGQRWGNPLYRWEEMEREDFLWWIERLGRLLQQVDLVRLDHFRGYSSYWEIPVHSETARRGRWVEAPGERLFAQVKKALGELPAVAEDLGKPDPRAERLRRDCGFPGMDVFQFAFSGEGARLPHQYPADGFAYTGTHDNDTLAGWWSGQGEEGRTPQQIEEELERARAYLGHPAREVHWAIIRTLMESPAGTVIIPFADLLGLGSEARMNRPGRPRGNWRWRLMQQALTPELAARLRGLSERTDRLARY